MMSITLRRICTLAFLCATLLFSLASIAKAQDYSHLVILNDSIDIKYFGADTYITEIHEEDLNANTIYLRHKNNLKGKLSNQKTINLNNHTPTTWIGFTVQNNSSEKEWILNFGDVSDGRLALIKEMVIMDMEGADNKVIVDTKSTNKNYQNLKNTAVTIELEKGKQHFLLIKLKYSGAFPNTITPSLMTQSYYLSTLQPGHFFSNVFTIFMLIAAGVVLAISLTHKAYYYTIFSAYILLQSAVFHTIQQNFYSEFSIIPDIIFLISITAIFTKWLASQAFYLNTDLDDRSMMALVVNGALIMIGFIASLFISDNYIYAKMLITFLPILLSTFIGIALACVLALTSRRADSYLLIGAWTALALALLSLLAIGLGFLKASAFNTNLYWISISTQVVIFIIAIYYKTKLDIEEDDLKKAREKRAEASMARLQQAKENSDQARLLRVIERERELMTELREREILRTEEMRKAKTAADQANNAKSAFLAVVSHEVRTPMNGIMGMIRLLKNTQMTKEQNEYLQSMETSGDTMLALLNDILDFEKIESGNMELENIEFNMPKLVQDVIILMTGHASEKSISLLADVDSNFPAKLKGDPTRLRQVILNLVSNAIKFTEQGSVTVKLEHRSSTDAEGKEHFHITCSVIDTGIGIAKEAQNSLFTPFTQAESSTTRKYGGTGLGLTICRRLIDAMHGEIKVTSTEGEGSTFSFTLHTEGQTNSSQSSEPSEDKKDTQQESISPMKIMVLEDNEINQRVLKGFLEKEGHDVVLRASAEDALEVCHVKQFDVILSDINLGGMDGLTFTKNLRLSPSKKIASTPVIALSGNVASEDKKACFDANINGFLPKPIDPETLNAMLLNVQNNEFEQDIILPEHINHDEEETPFTKEAQDKKDTTATSTDTSEKTSGPTLPISLKEFEEDFDSFSDLSSAENEYKPRPPNSVDERPEIINSLKENQETITLQQASSQDEYVPVKPDSSLEPVIKTPENTNAPIEPIPTILDHEINNDFQAIDPDFLEMVAGSLPTDQVRDLVDSCTEKSNEIIAELAEMLETADANALYEKSHELKGMCANFGMTLLAEISGKAEKLARDGNKETAIEEIKKLADANELTKTEIERWLETF